MQIYLCWYYIEIFGAVWRTHNIMGISCIIWAIWAISKLFSLINFWNDRVSLFTISLDLSYCFKFIVIFLIIRLWIIIRWSRHCFICLWIDTALAHLGNAGNIEAFQEISSVMARIIRIDFSYCHLRVVISMLHLLFSAEFLCLLNA